jgi:hypothetical protein
MAGGDVEGFAAVAFPIVRRVFAGLIANDLVSVQPMSLPSGLIFFLDFKFGSDVADGEVNGRLGFSKDDSIFGQGILGSEVTGGVKLNSETMDKQPYGLGTAYSSPTGSLKQTVLGTADADAAANAAIVFNGFTDASKVRTGTSANEALLKALQFDADLIDELGDDALADAGRIFSCTVALSDIEGAGYKVNLKSLSQIHMPLHQYKLSGGSLVDNWDTDHQVLKQVRRLTSYDEASKSITLYYSIAKADIATITAAIDGVSFLVEGDITVGGSNWEDKLVHGSFPTMDTIKASTTGGIGSIVGGAEWALENERNIPEIDIKVDSIAITAVTKKLKAKWTPELGQDLNAYHNLDAEVELTSILSEQIALEIDREILEDLVKGATAGTYYWSRSPGLFVNRTTGAALGNAGVAPDFTGTVSEWYETLIETINDVSAQIHRKTLRGGANFVVLSPEVANILEFTAGFRANVTADADKGDIGAVKVGSLNRKFDVIVDPYFPRNAILVGRKGSSFLESGYVYAPYVPLQTTPTIFGPEDFVPRKGVMTRYGKKMVRPDMYGLVIVRGLLGADDGTGR